MKIFISYVTTESKLAGKIKETLDDYGFDTFLAHEDIQPTEVWMDTIYTYLQETDIVLPLLTKGISSSVWCNQEIGIGLAMEKLIIPIKIDQNPEGFLSKYQALKVLRDKSFPIDKMFSVIGKDKKYGAVFRDFLIQLLAESHSFFEAEKNAKNILEIKDFTVAQLDDIMKASINNKQIYDGFKARSLLLNFMYQYKNTANSKLYKEFDHQLRL